MHTIALLCDAYCFSVLYVGKRLQNITSFLPFYSSGGRARKSGDVVVFMALYRNPMDYWWGFTSPLSVRLLPREMLQVKWLLQVFVIIDINLSLLLDSLVLFFRCLPQSPSSHSNTTTAYLMTHYVPCKNITCVVVFCWRVLVPFETHTIPVIRLFTALSSPLVRMSFVICSGSNGLSKTGAWVSVLKIFFHVSVRLSLV